MDNNAVTLILHGEQLGVLQNSLSLLEEQVNVLENTDVMIQGRLDALEATDTITEQRLDDLETAVNGTAPDDLTERVISLENITTSQQNDIDELAVADIGHNNDIATIKDVNNEFEQRISQLEEGNGIGNTSNVTIGFHARLADGDLPAYPDPILYEDVLVNIGNRYSPDTGIFTAHISGLYYFEQYWVMDYRYAQVLRMYKNNVIQCSSYGNSYGSGDYDYDYNSPSCSSVIELQSGDEVFVTSNSGVPVYGSVYTGFTGFLIKAYV